MEVGRENRADFKQIAKAIARQGTSYERENNPAKALEYYNKSLAEHRDRPILDKAKKIEKKIKDDERKALIDPEMFEQIKGEGNALFKKGDYPGSKKKYDACMHRLDDKDKKISDSFVQQGRLLYQIDGVSVGC